MDQAVMGDEVQQPVGGHPGTDPLQRVPARVAQRDQHDGQPGEHHREQVVLLEPALARLMVRAVPAPAGAMHEVLVGQVGDAFHGGQRYQKGQGIDQHEASVARTVAEMECLSGATVPCARNGSEQLDVSVA